MKTILADVYGLLPMYTWGINLAWLSLVIWCRTEFQFF